MDASHELILEEVRKEVVAIAGTETIWNDAVERERLRKMKLSFEEKLESFLNNMEKTLKNKLGQINSASKLSLDRGVTDNEAAAVELSDTPAQCIEKARAGEETTATK